MASKHDNKTRIKYHDEFHRDLRERVRRWRERNQVKEERVNESRRKRTILKIKPPRRGWWLCLDIVDDEGNVIGAVVRHAAEKTKPHHRISRWMPNEPLVDYAAAKAIIFLRRAQLIEWNSQSSEQ